MRFTNMFPLAVRTGWVFLIVVALSVSLEGFVVAVHADVSGLTEAESATPSDNLEYLFAVFFLTWVAFFGYIFFLSRRLVGLKSEVEELKAEINKSDSDPV